VYVLFDCLCDRWSSLDGEQYFSDQDQSLGNKLDQQNQKDQQEQLDRGKYSIWILFLWPVILWLD